MSPKKKPVLEATNLSISTGILARLLDLPLGVEVVDVRILAGGALTLTLTGVETTEETIDADYTVEPDGRRRFGFFKSAVDSSGIAPDPDPPREKE
jgi:hypothetical protein